MTQEIKDKVAAIVNEFKNVAGNKWKVFASHDDTIYFYHTEDKRTRYYISIKVFGHYDGKYCYKRDVEFASVSSCGTFTTESESVFDFYSLVGKLVNYEHLEDLKEKIKSIPFDED